MPHLPCSVDILIENHGSIYLLRPQTPAGHEWLKENCDQSGYQPFSGGTLLCEPLRGRDRQGCARGRAGGAVMPRDGEPHKEVTMGAATTSRTSKKGRDWEKWKAMFKQLGFCTATRYCLEPAGRCQGTLCPRHRAIKRQCDARYRARKVAARGWAWKRVPIERGGLAR